ncbi:uncharacterized protein LOC114364288 [Ostrinia furnacalis]|uniref:uncharacterized protein LOC114364288 n=2 Tax=Ostrinia TaxID=29056 RepID=UPI0010397950|nr:uncharacterized protein LOC114364288 [Ostrinia furnacalis]XP_028176190.1 uncharacterized protein LOC114364288 [Ostrinia furnacalis]
MSYLSASENVGFSGIPQNISDGSCATQYKMAVEGVAGNCSNEVNMYIQDSSGDEQPYITHLNENFFHTKFKIDPNELYTFHDSDVIASEITVSHTEDAFIFPENVDVKNKMLDSPSKEIDLIESLTNGEIKEEIKTEVPNGHYPPISKSSSPIFKDTKAQKSKSQVTKEMRTNSLNEVRRSSVHSPKGRSSASSPVAGNKSSISSASSNQGKTAAVARSVSETFLDVFKREQGLVEGIPATIIKTEPLSGPPPPVKIPAPTPKKTQGGKATPQSKARRGRGPAVHEALQRIQAQTRVIPLPNRSWHAPGEELFNCGPLTNKPNAFRQFESSSSDDDNMPEYEGGFGSACVEESATESRGARLALRRAALRRHVARADGELEFAGSFREHRSLATLVKNQLSKKGASSSLPTPTVNHLLAIRGMPSLLTSQERRQLRLSGWSGGESASMEHITGGTCAEERCTQPPIPCGRFCLSHVTMAPEQRLYAPCAAVFAGGTRCKQPLLPLQDQTPLCTEHAWKRDNYDKLARDCRPKKAVRKRIWAAPVRPPRRPKRRRRPPPARPRPPPPAMPLSPHTAVAPQTPSAEQSLSEINVCSNSSTYDSSEDTAMGALSENEYITVASNSHELVEVEQVPHDDILDPSVLSQIPDEAFTEFFNQAEGGPAFAGSELAAALEAVLDERVLDERVLDERALDMTDSVFVHAPHAVAKNKIQVPASVAMEMSTSAPS